MCACASECVHMYSQIINKHKNNTRLEKPSLFHAFLMFQREIERDGQKK